jgi:uncharacterized membrane protein YeiB
MRHCASITYALWVVLTLASLAFATLWRLLLGQGPLERALRALDGSRR